MPWQAEQRVRKSLFPAVAFPAAGFPGTGLLACAETQEVAAISKNARAVKVRKEVPPE
jgi:hypothetical protein